MDNNSLKNYTLTLNSELIQTVLIRCGFHVTNDNSANITQLLYLISIGQLLIVAPNEMLYLQNMLSQTQVGLMESINTIQSLTEQNQNLLVSKTQLDEEFNNTVERQLVIGTIDSEVRFETMFYY
jgi:hypothetical protein